MLLHGIIPNPESVKEHLSETDSLPVRVQCTFSNVTWKNGSVKSTEQTATPAEINRKSLGYRLNPAVFNYLKDLFEETYGFFLTRDVFADKQRSVWFSEGHSNQR